MARILIVDDDENICAAFQQFLEQEGHTAMIASNAEDAVRNVESEHPELAIMDIRMPGTDGLAALQRMKEQSPETYVVMMTAYGTSQTSIEAMRLGAFDYITKPFGLDDLRFVINKALSAQSLSRTAKDQAESPWDKYSGISLVGSNPRMQEVYKLIGVLSANKVQTLISGERGSGKRLVAYSIHFNSARKEKEFVAVNCSSIPGEEIEAVLFGVDKAGAGTQAGKLERAAGGTLFIEEVQLLPKSAQDRLLRYLRDKSMERVGGSEPIAPDTRIIASATEVLAEVTERGEFNLELFDLLRLISIEIPPLRARRDDIPELVDYFIRRNNEELDRDIKGVESAVLKMFETYGWPGNVAQLENVVKRACILSRGNIITRDDIGESLDESAAPKREQLDSQVDVAVRQKLHQSLIESDRDSARSVFHDIITRIENTIVLEALAITGGNQVKAAEILGLNRATLRKKMNLEP